MYEFFRYKPNGEYLRAQDFIGGELPYKFRQRTDSVQSFMNAHLLHVGESRLTNKKISTGADDANYFGDFQNAWEAMMKSLKPAHQDIFRDEIDFRLSDAEFKFCGALLGKDFIGGKHLSPERRLRARQ